MLTCRRAIDIEDILHRTLRHLNERDEVLPQFSAPSILVADDIFLLPSCSLTQSR
jgi:PTS hybrid protein